MKSIKATQAMFPYSVEIDVLDENGYSVGIPDTLSRDEYDEIPYMWPETMTASEWVELFGEEVLPDYLEDGDGAEITIHFYDDFVSQSYHDDFFSSTCRVNKELEVIESDDDELEEAEQEAHMADSNAEQETKAESAPDDDDEECEPLCEDDLHMPKYMLVCKTDDGEPVAQFYSTHERVENARMDCTCGLGWACEVYERVFKRNSGWTYELAYC